MQTKLETCPGCAPMYLQTQLMPYPCSHFYIDINFGDRLYAKEKKSGSPFLFCIYSVTKFDINVKVTTWIGHKVTRIFPYWPMEFTL